jgi:hypothetical protein
MTTGAWDYTTDPAFAAYRKELGMALQETVQQPGSAAQRWQQVEARMVAWAERVTAYVEDLQQRVPQGLEQIRNQVQQHSHAHMNGQGHER